MEESKQKSDISQEKKIKIAAGTAYCIFQECFKKIGVLDGDRFDEKEWSIKLRKRLEKELPEYDSVTDYWLTYHNYLRDKYNILRKIIEDGNPGRMIGYETYRLRPLLQFLGIDDYEKLSNPVDPIPASPVNAIQLAINPHRQETVQIPKTPEQTKVDVLYAPRPYGRLNILRSPERGMIYFYENGDLVFTGGQSIHIKRYDLKTAETHLMHGIPPALWIKIEYEKEGKLCNAYFVEVEDDETTAKFAGPENLLSHFTKYLHL